MITTKPNSDGDRQLFRDSKTARTMSAAGYILFSLRFGRSGTLEGPAVGVPAAAIAQEPTNETFFVQLLLCCACRPWCSCRGRVSGRLLAHSPAPGRFGTSREARRGWNGGSP